MYKLVVKWEDKQEEAVFSNKETAVVFFDHCNSMDRWGKNFSHTIEELPVFKERPNMFSKERQKIIEICKQDLVKYQESLDV